MRILLLVLAVLVGFGVAVPASADQVVTDYQDPVQADPDVSRPSASHCTVTAVQHVFGDTQGKPYVGTLTPPKRCGGSWQKVVLDWTATSKGRQYDRLIGMWIGSAEVLRSSTPEPDPSGIRWHFARDVTEFAPLLSRPQPVVVSLDNVVNETYTGSYDVTVTMTYYQGAAPDSARVIPLSTNAKSVGWSSVGAGGRKDTPVRIPRNTDRLTAQIYARGGGGCEEFWWAGLPDEVAARDPKHVLCGGGAYREVTLAVDGRPAAIVAPYHPIYTGGVVPMLWRPISAIDAITTEPYTVDLTPVIPLLSDGHAHTVSVLAPKGIPGDNNTWTLGGNLFAHTDPLATRVTGRVSTMDVAPAHVRTTVSGAGLDVTVRQNARQRWSTAGVLRTSRGVVPVRATGGWSFDVTNTVSDDGATQDTRLAQRGYYAGADTLRTFDFPLHVKQSAQISSDNDYRITGEVHMGRSLSTVEHGRLIRAERNSIDAHGVQARSGGELTAADGSSVQRWRGLDDRGRPYHRTLRANHGYLT